MFCNSCGSRNTKNAIYCSKCGKKLDEDALENNNTIRNHIDNVLNTIKGMILNPVDTAKKFINDDNYIKSLIYLCVNIFLVAFFSLVLLKSISGLLMNNYNLGMNYMYDSFYTIPYFRVFLIIIMTCVIVYGLLSGICYLICNYLLKSKTSFYKMISWIGINSVFNTTALLLVVICMLISTKLGVIAYLIGTLLYTFNMFRTFEYTTNADKNKLGYVLTLAILSTLLIVVIVLPKLFF